MASWPRDVYSVHNNTLPMDEIYSNEEVVEDLGSFGFRILLQITDYRLNYG